MINGTNMFLSQCSFTVSVMAACAISNIVKSSLGPVGLDKMLVDDVGVRTFGQTIHRSTVAVHLIHLTN